MFWLVILAWQFVFVVISALWVGCLRWLLGFVSWLLGFVCFAYFGLGWL